MQVCLAAALVQLRLLQEKIEHATEVDLTDSELEQCPQPFRGRAGELVTTRGVWKQRHSQHTVDVAPRASFNGPDTLMRLSSLPAVTPFSLLFLSIVLFYSDYEL